MTQSDDNLGFIVPSIGARIRSKLLFIPATFWLVLEVLRGRSVELWIGDSNAMGTNHDVVNSMFMRGDDGQFILRDGARLMFSVAREGWSPRITRVARLISPFVRPGRIVPIFSAGEIDIRAHLVERTDEPLDFVEAYVEQCENVARRLKAKRTGYLWPPAQTTREPGTIWYPIIGTLSERLAAAARLRTSLVQSLTTRPNAVLIDFNDFLADPVSGGIKDEFTDDGVHTNAAAVAKIRSAIGRYQLFER